MHKLIRKGQVGLQIPQGGLNSFTPTPPNLASLVPGMASMYDNIKLPQIQVKNPYSSSTILGKQFNWDATQGSKFSQAFNKTNIGSTMSLAGGVADALGGLIPQKEQSALTTGLNQGYDAAANALMSIPGWGTIAGGIMKVGGMLSDGLTALGVGTDQMTTADKILDSKFLKLTPMGLINAFGAKKADTITKNNQAFETVGASYGGTSATVDAALEKSGKKYGLLSGRGRRKANEEIARAKMQQQTMSEIADDATERFNIQSSMSDINNRRYGLSLQGGYRQQAVRAGKLGMKVITDDQIEKARALLAQKGAKVKPKYNDWIKTVPQDRISPKYDLEKAFEVLPFEMLEKWRKATPQQLDKEEFHLRSIYELPNGDYEFLKLGTEKDNPEVHFETDTFYDGSNGLKESYDLIFNKDRNRYYYIKKSQKFQSGGKVNVIPDGALHARLNHMDVDNITKKGIPVITQEAGGEIIQHAEIERNEIIFTKEVTDQLEKLYRLGTDKAAIEAGKLLAIQIMENTQDNTGLMKEVV